MPTLISEPQKTERRISHFITKGSSWGKLLGRFLSGQVAVQAINFITGFFLLRWLSVTSYAQVSVALAFQGVFTNLIDMGFAQTIVALVGEDATPENIGRYLMSAKRFRTRMCVVMVTVAAFVFPAVVRHQHWAAVTKVSLFCAIASTLFAQNLSMYAAPLVINRNLKKFYGAQVAAGAFRLIACFAGHSCDLLSASVASWIAAASQAINGLLFKRASLNFITEPPQSDRQANNAMLKYVLPLTPGIVFSAFQGQVTIAIITYFGHTKNIAETAALGRLGALFVIFSAFNSVIVEPHVAKLGYGEVTKKYLFILICSVGLCLIVTILAFICPGPLLWLLGPQYRSLGNEIVWSVGGACISYVGGVLWTMNNARRWIRWWYAALYIPAVLATEIVCICTMRLSTTHAVLVFTVITSVPVLLANGAVGIHGIFGLRKSLSISNQLPT